MEIASIIDQELAEPHGNRKGLSYGQLAVLFLAYVASQSDHRLCAVDPWGEKHRQTLEMATGWNIGVKQLEIEDCRLKNLHRPKVTVLGDCLWGKGLIIFQFLKHN